MDATSGNDVNDGLSEAVAWQTLSKLNTALADGTITDGDTIKFKRGEVWSSVEQYALVVGRSSITLEAYGTGNAPEIQGNSTGTHQYGVKADGDGIHIQNMLFTTAQESCIRVSGSDCEVNNCEFTNSGSGMRIEGANCIIRDNSFHDLNLAVVGDHGAVGIWVFQGANGTRIYDNTFVECRDGTGGNYDGGAVELINAVDDVEIYNNFARYCNGFLEFGASTGGTISNVSIYNNVMADMDRVFGYSGPGTTFAVSLDNVQFYHNTCVDIDGAIVVLYFSSPSSGLAAGDLILRDNIFYGHTVFCDEGASFQNFTHEYNSYSASSPDTPGTGEVTATNPLLVAASPANISIDVNDYKLQAGSPVIGTGIASVFTTDYDGVTRGDPPDLGAFEHVA